MTLDYLCLDNFGAYCGRQEAHLTPEEGRPVILFGGMNGGGKTTLLDAMQLALYGSKAKLSNRGRMGYRNYRIGLASEPLLLDPETFQITLTGRGNQPLPFDRHYQLAA
jgi:DNA sulfur modification protein DndD